MLFFQHDEPTPSLDPMVCTLTVAAEHSASEKIGSAFAVGIAESRVQAIITGPDDTYKLITRPRCLTWFSFPVGR